MEKKAFFGESGLTSTSANYYANIAKELRRKTEAWLENLSFVTEGIRIIGEPVANDIRIGIAYKDLTKVSTYVKSIADLNSLIAFFREAIKEKERLTKEAASWTDEEARILLTEQKAKHNLEEPVRRRSLTEEDVVYSWTVGEQEKYLSLQAEAAAFGKAIHEDGTISRARIELSNRLSKPTDVQINGRDTIIHEFTPSVDIEDVNNVFFSLQNQYREVQAELNGMKKKITDAVEADKLAADEEYRVAVAKWNSEDAEYARRMAEITANESVQRDVMSKQIADLKILVPNRLKKIFEVVKSK